MQSRPTTNERRVVSNSDVGADETERSEFEDRNKLEETNSKQEVLREEGSKARRRGIVGPLCAELYKSGSENRGQHLFEHTGKFRIYLLAMQKIDQSNLFDCIKFYSFSKSVKPVNVESLQW